MEDPAQSSVAGKLGYAILPAGPAGAYTGVWGWSYGINAASEKQDLAWDVITWLTSRYTHQDYLNAGGIVSRSSAFDDPANREQYPYFEATGQALAQAGDLAAKGLSVVPKTPLWTQMSDIMGNYGSEAFVDQMTSAEAVARMQEDIEAALRRAGELGTRVTSSSSWARRFRRAQPFLFMGPALLVTAILAIAPTIQLVRASTRAWKLGQPLSEANDVGLHNFERLLTGSVPLGHSLKLTVIYTVVALVVELLFGLGIALLLDRALAGRSFVMTVLLVPMILMPAMVGMIWKLYFSHEGLVNWVLGPDPRSRRSTGIRPTSLSPR